MSAPFSTESSDEHDSREEAPSRHYRQRAARPTSQAEYNRELSNLTKMRNKGQQVRTLADEMLLEGFKFNRDSYHSLILSAMRSRNLQDVFYYFDEMRTSGYPPDMLIYIFVINACVQCKHPAEAFRVVDMMEEAGFQPSIQVFTGLLNACAALGDVQKAQSVVARMEEAGLTHTPFTAAALIDTYKNQRPKYRELLGECANIMEASRRFDPSRKVPIKVYHAMMGACISLGDYEKAVTMLGEMKNEGLEPDPQTLHLLVTMYLSQNLLDLATELLADLRSKGVKPNMDTYLELLRATLRRKTPSSTEEAFALLGQLEQDGGSFNAPAVNWLLPLASHASRPSLDFAHAVWERIMNKPIIPAKEALFSYLKALELRAPERTQRRQSVRQVLHVLSEFQEEKQPSIYTREAADNKLSGHHSHKRGGGRRQQA